MRGIMLDMIQLWVLFRIFAVDHQQFSQNTPIMAIFAIIDGTLIGPNHSEEQCNSLFFSFGVP